MFQLRALANYALAALAVAGTLTLQLFIRSFAPNVTPYLLFIFPVLFSAWFFGRDTGHVATALSAVVIFYFLTPADWSFYMDYPVELVALIIFMVEATIISFLAAAKKKQEEVLEKNAEAFGMRSRRNLSSRKL